ncbi:high mobility group protein 20A-like isoform X1 [Haliotis rufescens]|uniref:high mobility group protein 20A-like isoform X1 n=1 Tax=Haliotis rufescens TaxID=6454 RepID=UPI001EB00CCD|nr:high mobility group protein 20A-like isoform X1 [Haliotis rufescens]
MMDHGDIMPSSVQAVISSSSFPVLNGTDVGLGITFGTDATDSDKNDISVSLSSSLMPDTAVLVETPRGLMLSVGDGNVSLGNISTTTDQHGRHLLPLPGTITQFTPVQQDGLVGASASHVFDSPPDCTGDVSGSLDVAIKTEHPITTVTTTVTTTHEETKKRKGGWPKGKKRKNVPEINAPRAPMTGYVLYAIERRQEIKESHPEIMFSDVTKILGQEWSSMSPEKKQKYLTEAEADKQRYITQLKVFQQSDTYQNFLKKKKLKVLCGEDSSHLDAGDPYSSLIDVEEDSISELYCRVCNQYFSSVHNKKEHMFGRQHLQAITGELEKEMERQQQQSLTSTSLLTSDLNTESLTSDMDLVEGPRLSMPVDIGSFIQEFEQRNVEREQEIKTLRRALKTSQEGHVNMCKEIQTLKDYENKLEQNTKTMKAYSMSIAAQIDGLKMVPTLFGVINF